jgi:hypothetical protein
MKTSKNLKIHVHPWLSVVKFSREPKIHARGHPAFASNNAVSFYGMGKEAGQNPVLNAVRFAAYPDIRRQPRHVS